MSEEILDKEKAIEIMKDRGYTLTANSGNEQFLFFIKTVEDKSIHAKVNLKAEMIELRFPNLTWLCELNTTNFDFFHKEFNKYEETLYFYALRCLGKDVKDAMEEIKVKGFYGAVTKIPIEKYVVTLEDRKKAFWSKITQVGLEYGKEMCKEFYVHWTEMNEGGRKMRFEMEKVFDVKKRLVTWDGNNKNWKVQKKTFVDNKIEKQNEETKAKSIDKSKLF